MSSAPLEWGSLTFGDLLLRDLDHLVIRDRRYILLLVLAIALGGLLSVVWSRRGGNGSSPHR